MPNIPKTMFSVSSLDGGHSLQLPNPDFQSGKNLIATMVDSGRNAAAEVVANKIGRDQEKTELTWSWLPKDEWEAILQFFDANFFFNFHYYSRVRKTKITRVFYVGDREDQPQDVDTEGVPIAYINCKANVIDTGRGV